MNKQEGFAIVQGLMLSCYSLMIIHLIMTGTIVLYISSKLIWLSECSAILLVIIAIAKLVPTHHTVAHSCCDHGHTCVSLHHNHSPKTKGLLQMAIFMIPLILGFFMQPRVLTSTALSNSINTAGPIPFYAMHIPKSDKLSNIPIGISVQPLTPKSINSVGQESDLMQLYLNLDDHPEQVYNQQWKLTGFVYKDPKLAKNQFVVTRFVITCCIVDATPIGIIVESPDAPNLKADTWVKVDGLLQKRIIGGAGEIRSVHNFHVTTEGVPYLVASSCKIVSTPKDPYLTPPMQ